QTSGLNYNLRVRLIFAWRGYGDMYVQTTGGDHEGVRNVVAIPNKRQLQALEFAEPFLQSLHICQKLARMIEIIECVDDRHARPSCQLLDSGVREYARDNCVGPAVQITSHVFHRFTAVDFVRVAYCVIIELLDRKLESKARAQ